jgi:hypothetical protein
MAEQQLGAQECRGIIGTSLICARQELISAAYEKNVALNISEIRCLAGQGAVNIAIRYRWLSPLPSWPAAAPGAAQNRQADIRLRLTPAAQP